MPPSLSLSFSAFLVLWTKEEDELLTNVVAKEGAGQWDMISRHFQLRNGK